MLLAAAHHSDPSPVVVGDDGTLCLPEDLDGAARWMILDQEGYAVDARRLVGVTCATIM